MTLSPLSNQSKFDLNGERIPTGYDNGLSQDYNRKLAKWFSTRLSARNDVRRAFPNTPTKKESNESNQP